MNKPNNGQRQKIERLLQANDIEGLKAYCEEKGFEMPVVAKHLSYTTADGSTHSASNVVMGAVAPVVETHEHDLKRAAYLFKLVYDRLEQNAAHSVISWKETEDLKASLEPWMPAKEEEENYKPVPPAPLPEGQRWALVVEDCPNPCLKKFVYEGERTDAKRNMLYVRLDAGRMCGRRIKVRDNPNKEQGGFVLA